MFFYYLKSKIASKIRMRLKVKFTRASLRNLAEGDPVSETATCNIKDAYKNKVDVTPDGGENIDYNCEAAKPEGYTVNSAKLDDNYPLQVGEDIVPLDAVGFDDEETNIANAKNLTAGVLDESSISGFTFTGTPLESNFLEGKDGQKVTMTFVNYPDGEGSTTTVPEKYECIIKGTDSLACTGELQTTPEEISKGYSNNDEIYIKINMKDQNTFINANGASNGNVFYSKSSSGLSGGAIAGIVIACVAVLIAAAVAAIMLRKPSPPIDNTTITGLKTENI